MLIKNVHVVNCAKQGVAFLPWFQIGNHFDDLWSRSV